ncbi:MAG TPA: hypothetical protein VK518_20890, partial [Puia sp.]|nr:hypothetical protein [Puia sp.]
GLIGWRISNEPFMQDLISPSVLNNLKFRASYGKLGDDQFNNYQWVAGYNYPAPGAVINGSYVNGVASRGIPDYALSWVNSKTFNVGADFDLFNGLIGGSVEYFNRTRTGLPAFPNAQIPGSSGLSPLESNLNADVTKGIEVTLTHHQTIHQVTYNVSGNIGFSRIKQGYVEETRAASAFDQYQGVHSNPSNPPGSQSLQYTGNQSGRYSNIWWGYQYGGQFTTYNQIYNYNVNTGGGNQAVLPGNYYYQDINHDGVIDGKDMVPLATRDLPMINFGMTLSAAYRNFDAAVLLQGATDFHVQYAEQLAQPLMYQRSALSEFINRWHPADPNANLYDPNTVWIPGNYSATGTPIADGSKAVQNATYMRIKSLEIGYTLPKKVLNRIGIQNVRVYINSYNLATITGLKNSDPEHPGTVATGQDFNVSQAGYLYPMNRTFSCGASVSF